MGDNNVEHLENVEERCGVAKGHLKSQVFVGRKKKRLGDRVGIRQFGVNYTVLEPGAQSSLRHWHTGEDEFVFVLSGELVLIDDNGEQVLHEGMFCGFAAGDGNGHCLVNRSSAAAAFLEVGSRKPGGDTVYYPDDDFGPIDR